MTRSTLSGWWSRLVVTFAALLALVAVLSLFDEDDALGAAFVGGLAGLVIAGLLVRERAPRVAAWLLLVGVGVPGVGFFWFFLIPTALALIIVIGGVITGEIGFFRPPNARALRS